MKRAWIHLFAWLAAVIIVSGGCGRSSAYPSRPITMVVPWAAGGGTDAVARVIATCGVELEDTLPSAGIDPNAWNERKEEST